MNGLGRRHTARCNRRLRLPEWESFTMVVGAIWGLLFIGGLFYAYGWDAIGTFLPL